MKKGFVYVMTNPSMPGLIKVGMSRRVPTDRIFDNDLSSTGIPDPFEVQYYAFFDDMIYAEKRVHQKLCNYHYKKEFFKTDVASAIWAIEHSDIAFTKLYSNPDNGKEAQASAEQKKYENERAEQIAYEKEWRRPEYLEQVRLRVESNEHLEKERIRQDYFRKQKKEKNVNVIWILFGCCFVIYLVFIILNDLMKWHY
jgi:hypothetical protein